MGGIFQEIEHRRRFASHCWQAQVPGRHVRAGGLLHAVPDGLVIDHWGRPGRRLAAPATALARFAAALFGRAVGQQAGQAIAVPVIGPVQPGQAGAEVEQQRPGTEHRVQIPVEGTAPFRPVEGQPGAPVQRLARPAQVQPGEAEEHQCQGAGRGDLLAAVTHGEEAVQPQHQAEERLAARFTEQLAGVGVEEAHRPAPLARRRGEEHPRGAVSAGIDPQAGDRLARRHLDFLDQRGRRQRSGRTHLDTQHVRIERAQDLALEGIQRTGYAHQGQDQAGSDAEEPVQLKEDFLQHDEHLVQPKPEPMGGDFI